MLRALQRGDGELVLLFAGEVEFLRTFLGEAAHQSALVVRIFQAVEEHVVQHLLVTHAIAGTRLGQQVGRVAHGLHAAGDHDVVGAGADEVVGQHGGFHGRAAHLVYRGTADAERQSAAEAGLPCRCLSLAGGQHAAHDDFLHLFGLDAGAFHGGANRGGAEFRCGEALEVALQTAHRGAGGGDDDDGIVQHGGLLVGE